MCASFQCVRVARQTGAGLGHCGGEVRGREVFFFFCFFGGGGDWGREGSWVQAGGPCVGVRLRASGASACVACVCVRLRGSACVCVRLRASACVRLRGVCVCVCPDTYVCVSCEKMSQDLSPKARAVGRCGKVTQGS